MRAGEDNPPAIPRHRAGFDPPAGQQRFELLARLRKPHALARPHRLSPLPLTFRALASQRVTCRIFPSPFGDHLPGGPPRGEQARASGEFPGGTKAVARAGRPKVH
jgi:hypothetical protein